MKAIFAFFLFAGAFSFALAADTYQGESIKFAPTSSPTGVSAASESIEDSTSYSVEMNIRERGVASGSDKFDAPSKIDEPAKVETEEIQVKDTEYWRRPASDQKVKKPEYWHYSPKTLLE